MFSSVPSSPSSSKRASPTTTSLNSSKPSSSSSNSKSPSLTIGTATTSLSAQQAPPSPSSAAARKIRLNIDLNQIQKQNETTIAIGLKRSSSKSHSLNSSPINHLLSPNSILSNNLYSSNSNQCTPATMITVTSSYRSTVEKDDLMKIVPYSPHIPSPIMSKGLFESDGCEFSPRDAHWLPKQKKTITKEKSYQSLPPQVEENEFNLMSPRHIVETYSTTKKKFTEIKNNPIFDTALLENKAKVAEFKSEKFKILREFCDMNSTLDVCYKELGSFTSLENPQDPLKVVVDKAAFEQSPIHEHEDALHKRRQLKRMMKNAKNQNIANDYASDMDLKSLLLICELREKEKKEFPTPRKSLLKSPRTPRTPGRNAKLPPLKFSEQYRLSKLRQSMEVSGTDSSSPISNGSVQQSTVMLSPSSPNN